MMIMHGDEMMKYEVRELSSFTVLGQEIQVCNSQKRNMQITTMFWKQFNQSLKKTGLSQSGNWVKYAFMQRRENQLFYFCAIPQGTQLPDSFITKKVPAYKYVVVEHLGTMDTIYQSYHKLYKQLLPKLGYTPLQDEFLHFEKYDHRFHWNRSNSVIEIWVPFELSL